MYRLLTILFLVISLNVYAEVSPISINKARHIKTDTTNFNGALSATDTTVQTSLETLDDSLSAETDPVVGAVNGIVKANGAGTISAASAGTDYLVTEVDGSTTNEINTITCPDANVTAGVGITFAQSGSIAITEATDTVTFTVTETDPNALLSGGTDNVKDTHIDWGTGATQVSADDVPDGSTNAIVTLTQESNFETAYNHSQDNTQAHSDYMLNSGDVATGTYDFGGAVVEIPNGTSGTTDATGESYLDTDGDGGTNFSGEMVQIYTGAANKYLFPIALPLAASQDNFVPTYDAVAKTIQWEAGAAGSGDITSVGDVASGTAFDGTAGTTLTFNNAGGDATIDYDGTDFSINKPIDITGGLTTSLDITVTGSDLTIGAAGVKLTGDGDGAITLLGLGNGFDEDLTVNLDDTENTGTVTSSTGLATLNFSSIALQESGAAVLNNDEIDASSELLAIMDDETGTGVVVFGTSPSFTTSVIIGNASTSAGLLQINEDTDAGTNNATFTVPALAADTDYTLPPDDGDAGEQLQTNGSGVLTWESSGVSSVAFLAIPASTQSDIATDTAVTIILGTEQFDVGGNFASNTFTAPVTGKYILTANFYFLEVDSAYTVLYYRIITSNKTYSNSFHPADTLSADSDLSLCTSVVADMDVGDTAYLSVYLGGGSQQTDIHTETWFSGSLL